MPKINELPAAVRRVTFDTNYAWDVETSHLPGLCSLCSEVIPSGEPRYSAQRPKMKHGHALSRVCGRHFYTGA